MLHIIRGTGTKNRKVDASIEFTRLNIDENRCTKTKNLGIEFAEYLFDNASSLWLDAMIERLGVLKRSY